MTDGADEGERAERAMAAVLASPPAAEALIATLVRGCGLGVALVDTDRRYAWVNAAMATLNGAPAEDHAGRAVADIGPSAAAAAIDALVDRALAGGRRASAEMSLEAHEATGARSRRLVAHLIAEPGRPATGVAVIADELSPRERAVRDVLSGESSFADLADALPALVWISDDEDGCVFANRGWTRLTGQERAHHLGDGWTAALHPDDRRRRAEALRATREGGAPLELEYRLRRADGTFAQVIERAVAQHDEHGALTGLVGSALDLTEGRALRAASAESRRLLDLVIDSAPVGFALLDPDLRYQRVNAALAAIDGVPAEDHLGRHPRDIAPRAPGPAGADDYPALLARVLRSRGGVDELVVVEDPAGAGPLTVDAHHRLESWFPVRDPATDEVTAVGAFVTDIGDRVRAQERLRLLDEVGVALDAALGEEERLDRLLAALVPRLADGCRVQVVDERGATSRVAGRGVEPLEGVGPGERRALLGGVPVLEDDPDGGCLLAVALRARGRTLGVLTLVLDSPWRRYAPEDVELADQLGRRAGVALDNARLYERQRDVATVLQQSLLPPRLPETPGLEAAARYVAMGEGAEVGGDFYDLFAAGGSTVAVIGDVCGKGPRAAALTSLARHGVRALARHDPPPRGVLVELNDLILRERGAGTRFFTVLYAQIGGAVGAMWVTVASGGHPLPLLAHADGRVETVGEPGTLLGTLPRVSIAEVRAGLAPGDALVLYTDGVTEARRGGELFGVERLHRVLRETAGATADAIAARIEAAVRDFRGGPLDDDLALLVLRVLPEAPPARAG